MNVLLGAQQSLVHLHAPARAVRPQFEVTVLGHVRILDIPGAFAALFSGDAGVGAKSIARTGRQSVFKNTEVRLAGAKVQVDRCGQWPHRVVRCDAHHVGLGQRIDLQHLSDPADNADIRLNDVAAAHLQKTQKFKAAVERLAGGQSAMQAALELSPGLEVFGANRFFKKQRVVRRQGIAQLHCLGGLENFGVRIKSQLVLRFNGLAQLAEILGRRAHHFAPAVAVHVQPVGAELESFDAPLRIQRVHGVTRLRRIGRGVHAGVNLHLVTHMPAHQLVHRHAQRFG